MPGETSIGLIAKYVRARRISLKDQFDVKDPMRHGRLTASKFAQVLQLIGVHLSKDDILELASAYNDPACNFVDYPRFVDDVNSLVGDIFTDKGSTQLVVNPPDTYTLSKSGHVVQATIEEPSGWDGLRDRIKDFLIQRRVRLYEFFQGFDELRRGFVTLQKFGTVLSQAGIELTEADMQLVEGRYGESVNYREFVREVDDSFNFQELEKRPSTDPRTLTHPVHRAIEVKTGHECDQILGKFAAAIRSRRMAIREQFYDYDKSPRKGFISAQQFKQGIYRMGLCASASEMEAVAQHYAVSKYGDIDYRRFCNDVDPSQD